MLRVVVHPNPQGGVTYLYDDLSDQYKLEWRFNALYRMQNETLETLREGVVVFGADGRLKFANPAFVKLWRLDPKLLEPKRPEQKPRFDEIADLCQALHPNSATWSDLRGFVTGLSDMRTGLNHRIERTDGVWLDVTAQPLPEGAALLTFVNVTADVNVERALTEQQQGAASRPRSCATTSSTTSATSCARRSTTSSASCICSARRRPARSMTAQLEYVGYRAANPRRALLAIIDDILDLATIDADAMELDWSRRSTSPRRRCAPRSKACRIGSPKQRSNCASSRPDGCRNVPGDAERVRQILFNLLSNAIGFSRPGQTVTLAALRRDHGSRVQGQRSRTRHSARDHRTRVRSFRDRYRRLASSRPRTRPVDRASLRGAAWRQGSDRHGARRRHDRHLHLSRRTAREAERERRARRRERTSSAS